MGSSQCPGLGLVFGLGEVLEQVGLKLLLLSLLSFLQVGVMALA